MIVVLDGEVLRGSEARIPALDRAAWYGDAAFETFRTFEGRVLALELRLERLERSCAVLGIPFGARERWVDELARGLAAFGAGDAYVRLSVSRGVGASGLLPSTDCSPSRAVFVGALPAPRPEVLELGLRAISAASPYVPGATRAAGAKLAAYVEPMLALTEARRRGADDVIGLDREGFLTEAATANVLVWDGRALLTPPDSLGILPGVTRDLVLGTETARAHGARSRMVSIHDAYRAQEIVLTSSVRGVVSVRSLDGVAIGEGRPGPVAAALAAAYAALVQQRARRPGV